LQLYNSIIAMLTDKIYIACHRHYLSKLENTSTFM